MELQNNRDIVRITNENLGIVKIFDAIVLKLAVLLDNSKVKTDCDYLYAV